MPTETLKWILIIFIAGFIGYFGKYLAKIFLGEVKKKPMSKYEYKLKKKELKAKKK